MNIKLSSKIQSEERVMFFKKNNNLNKGYKKNTKYHKINCNLSTKKKIKSNKDIQLQTPLNYKHAIALSIILFFTGITIKLTLVHLSR